MHPILFTLPGGFPVHSYGVMLGLGCVLGAHVAVYLAERSKIDGERAWWFCLTVIAVAMVGGRVHDLWVRGKLLSSELFAIQHAGRTAYGGYIGGTLAGIAASRWLRVPFWRMADAVAPTLVLGLGLTRIGCFLYGCDYGLRTDAWGVSFPPGSPAWEDQRQAGLIDLNAPGSLPVLPVQLVASAIGFLLFAFLVWVWFRRPRREGTVFLWFVISYGLARAGLEQIRDDAGRGVLLGLSTSTTIGLVTAVASGLLLSPALAWLRPLAGPIVPAGEPGEGEADPQAEGPVEAGPDASPPSGDEAAKAS